MSNIRRFYWITHLFVLLALIFLGSQETFAQEDSPTVKFNLFSVEGLVTGKTLTIDAAFGEKKDIPVPAPFSFLIPDQEGVIPLYHDPTKPGGMLIKVSFATEDRQLIENLQFVVMTLPPGEPVGRFVTLTGLLVNKVFPSAVANSTEHQYLGARKIQIGQYDAVEILGKYLDEELGLVYLRIVGIPNPDGTDGVFAVANLVDKRLNLNNVDDFSRTASGTALRYFKYLSE